MTDKPATEPNWRRRRLLLTLSLVLWFVCLVYFGAHVILFHKLMPLTAADFAANVQPQMVAVVREIKEYQRLNGAMPDSLYDLYGKNPTQDQIWFGRGVHSNGYYHDVEFGFITYDFSPGQEGWYVSGPFAGGRIPVPPVNNPATSTTDR
jgi:hypothetical protein